MAFVFNNSQRRVLPQVITALQRLEEDPEQLAHERNHRYSEPPPPYPSSGETTQPPSPEPPVIDEYERRYCRLQDRLQSTPYAQFHSQARGERARIIHQLKKEFQGRKQTLPFDQTLDFQANAENNVRSRWIEQGIWKSGWGPAWPKGTELLGSAWKPRPKGPEPHGRWGHEREPEPELEPELELPCSPKYTFSLLEAPKPERPNAVTKESVAASRRDITKEPTAVSKRDTSASRPYYQFLYQVSKECEWIKDELQSQRSAGIVDIEAKAYKTIKDIWIEDKIWNPKWGELPGMTWIHEEPDEEEAEAPNGFATGPVGELPPDAVANGEERLCLSYPRLFDLAPTPDVDNDRTDSNKLPSVPGGVEASSGETARPTGRGKRRNNLGPLPTVVESTEAPEEPAGRILRSVRLSRVEKPSKSNSQAIKVRLLNQSYRSVESTETSDPTGQDGTLPGSGSGDIKSYSIHQQISPQRTTRRDRRSSLGPAESSRVSKPKSKPKDRQQTDASPNYTISELPLSKTWNEPRQRNPSPIEAQTRSVRRRSARIAAQIPKSEVILEQSFKAKVAVKRKRKTAASSTNNANKRSRSKRCDTSIAGDSHRIRKRQSGAKRGTKAGSRPRS